MPPWAPGQSGNPSGRPKNTLKDYTRRKLAKMTDEEKEKFLLDINKIDQWEMGEGKAPQDLNLGSNPDLPFRIIIEKDIEKDKNGNEGKEDKVI